MQNRAKPIVTFIDANGDKVTPVEEALLFSLLAGLAIPVGGMLAAIEGVFPDWHRQEFHHGIMSFGGGALLAAVAFVLVPEGIHNLPIWMAVLSFFCGAIIFMLLDIWVQRAGNSLSQLLAMLLDFVPEAIALGVFFTLGHPLAGFLALLIGIQNLPEGFNAYREVLTHPATGCGKTLIAFLAMSLTGPLATFLGIQFFVSHLTLLKIIMLGSAGGIFYLVFQDVAPQARLENRWIPGLGAVCGFLVGMIGFMMTA